MSDALVVEQDSQFYLGLTCDAVLDIRIALFLLWFLFLLQCLAALASAVSPFPLPCQAQLAAKGTSNLAVRLPRTVSR